MTCACYDPIVFGCYCPRWKTTIATAGHLLLGNTTLTLAAPIKLTWNWAKAPQTTPYHVYLHGTVKNQ